LAKLYLFPIANIRSHLLRAGQTFAFLSWPASGSFSFFGRQIEDFCVSLYSRNQMSICHLFSRKRSVKAVCRNSKSSFRQPLIYLFKHLLSQFYNSRAVLSVQSDVYRQANRFAAPGRSDLQRQDNQIQSPRIDNAFLRGAYRVSPVAGPVDFSATVMKDGIVQSQRNCSCRIKETDQQNRQDLPSLSIAQLASGKNLW